VVTRAVGEVVLVRFPFFDRRQSKLRPALTEADSRASRRYATVVEWKDADIPLR
jgi:hypothetical protein